MAGVVKHNIPCPPAQAISYTNFHIETSIEVVSNRVFVGGLTENIVEEDLNNFFQRYGKIQNSRIIKNSNNLSKGYGFVTFVDEASATRVKDLATSDPNTFCIQNCRITVKDARKKGITKRVTHCAFPNFQVPSLIENSNQGIPQQVYPNGEYQPPLSLQNDGSVAIQTGSHQQFLTPPQTPTNFTPSPPPSTFTPPFGYYQYPYQYPYNPYYQVNHPPYQIYQYAHVSHSQNHSYNLDETNVGEYRDEYNGELQQTPIVTIESDSEENS
uniref:RRM domain-containing protein n=1 Tax=Strongyloides venezuelensis TaxID=75913 RepID=A0A0K0F6T1_STRVS